jgi:hypothetical protein
MARHGQGNPVNHLSGTEYDGGERGYAVTISMNGTSENTGGWEADVGSISYEHSDQSLQIIVLLDSAKIGQQDEREMPFVPLKKRGVLQVNHSTAKRHTENLLIFFM